MVRQLRIYNSIKRDIAPCTVLDKLCSDFIEAQQVNSRSKAVYIRQLRQFCVWLNKFDKQFNNLSSSDLMDYKNYLILIKKSSYTVSGYISVVRKFFEWLESNKIYPNIAKPIKLLKKPKGFRKDCLTPEQINLTLQNIDRSTLIGSRNYAIINLMARTGLRTIEVSNALIGDLRQMAGEAVLWVQGKGRDTKDEFVLLVHETLQPIREYLAKRDNFQESDPLFTDIHQNNSKTLATRTLSKIIKEAFKKVGLNDRRLSAHSLRHTAISLSIKGGASLEQAQAMARHTDPKTTMVYFHNQNRIQSGAERFIKF